MKLIDDGENLRLREGRIFADAADAISLFFPSFTKSGDLDLVLLRYRVALQFPS